MKTEGNDKDVVIVDGQSYRVGDKIFGHDDTRIPPEVAADGHSYRINGRLYGHDGRAIPPALKL
jgi:hypothetical protein